MNHTSSAPAQSSEFSRDPAAAPQLNRLVVWLVQASIVFSVIVYLPMWGTAMGITAGKYAGRLSELGATNRVLLGVRELLPLLAVGLAVAAHPRLLRQRVDGALSACVGVLLVGAVVFTVRFPELSLLKCGIILARFGVVFVLGPVVAQVLRTSSPRAARGVAGTVVGVLALNLVLCLAQTRLMPGFEGGTALGARTIGISNNPNTAGSLLALAPLLLLVPAAGARGMMLLFSGMCFVGVLTTGSRAAIGGMAVLLVVVLARCYPRLRRPLLAAGVVALVPLVLSLNRLSGRLTELQRMEESPRLGIARELVTAARVDELLIGRGLGVGSNSFAGLFGVDHELTIIADSQLTSWFAQFGLLGLFILLAGTLRLFREFGPDGMIFALYFLLFSVTMNLIEVYPTSPILMILAGLYGARRRELDHE